MLATVIGLSSPNYKCVHTILIYCTELQDRLVFQPGQGKGFISLFPRRLSLRSSDMASLLAVMITLLCFLFVKVKSLAVSTPQAQALFDLGVCTSVPSTTDLNCSWVSDADCQGVVTNNCGSGGGVCCDETLGIYQL